MGMARLTAHLNRMALLTLNKLCELVGQDRRAIAPLVETVPYTVGPNRSHLYESTQALAAIYRCKCKQGGPQSTLAEAKIRSELAAAIQSRWHVRLDNFDVCH